MRISNHSVLWMGLASVMLACCMDPSAKEIQNPAITAIYPTSDTLPENLLRLYLHFSKSMRTTGNLEKIRLLDENGQEVVGAIFNNVYELWDKEQKQLTLIFDPSRVKTGLMANEEKGRSLQVGKKYRLVIGRLEDVDGHVMKEVYTKSFYVSGEDRLSPNIELWNIELPTANGKSPLVLQFPEMLDQLSLRQRLQLTNHNNEPITGVVDIGRQETEWRFTPSEKWVAGDYVLHVHGRLEDPCGNNLNGLFDHTAGGLKNRREGQIETIHLKIAN
ncbi:MAG: hypothetical protein AAFV95_27215 [Bacteroidota bacterium]